MHIKDYHKDYHTEIYEQQNKQKLQSIKSGNIFKVF